GWRYWQPIQHVADDATPLAARSASVAVGRFAICAGSVAALLMSLHRSQAGSSTPDRRVAVSPVEAPSVAGSHTATVPTMHGRNVSRNGIPLLPSSCRCARLLVLSPHSVP